VKTRLSIPMLLLALVALATMGAHSFPLAGGPTFDLSWHTVDGGGGTSYGGALELSGTIGQPDTGAVMTGEDFELTGGFWAAPESVGPTCPEDLNGDDVVNVFDLLELLSAWGTCAGCPEDFNGDDVVNVFDLLALLSAWGPCE
jgi:hypothetical protein